MSFGTGHHATTALMVAGMAELDFNGKSVIDFGTGTGILAILAEKMGATNILAIDCDDWSIENTGENIMANDCNKIKLIKAGQFPKHQKADIILANINLNVILDNLDTLTAAVLPGGSVLFSGILHHDEAVLKAELHKYHIENVTVRQKGDWSMLQVGSIAT
jgi:ribosomal protein L11 methyltransferase